MKKTILASAIAAATFSGAALAEPTLSASELAAKMVPCRACMVTFSTL